MEQVEVKNKQEYHNEASEQNHSCTHCIDKELSFISNAFVLPLSGMGWVQFKFLAVFTSKTRAGGRANYYFFFDLLTGVRPTTNYFVIF